MILPTSEQRLFWKVNDYEGWNKKIKGYDEGYVSQNDPKTVEHEVKVLEMQTWFLLMYDWKIEIFKLHFYEKFFQWK